ncbi:hypothetical protein CYMTET_8269 [Cymbomonas tetramitiformis]|uniref:serine--tRNA ligase n=1 Tax=Cymbomonas tetramitiformis TaxID=36881 RepID=A0AAE0LGN6_9CHLO|nr:hypothetical protein CYMTET_8269 [Cymbomonas tetramitiformis]
MLDINLFRADKGGDPEKIRESQRRRYADVDLVDKVIELDAKWVAARFQLDECNRKLNAAQKEIGARRKAKQDDSDLQKVRVEAKEEIEVQTKVEQEMAAERDAALKLIGNLVHDSVPVSDDEENNTVERTFGVPRDVANPDEKLFNHVDLVQMLDIAKLEEGQAVAGGRGYYLVGAGMMLNQALINYATQFLYLRGHTPVHTPFMMRKTVMGACAQLSEFDEALYHVSGEGEDKYLIATSEQTLCAMHQGMWLEAPSLPMKYAGYSTCFRKEAGSHGRDTAGIFRVHQFEKVEQFVITTHEGNSSWEEMEQMIKNSEDFYQSLEIPYKVINIVSGELNDAAAKKYDLEASFPASKTFRELVSCSNCTDFQSRRLEVRLRSQTGPGAKEKEYVHMLNSTLTATERTLCCLLENYQTPEGVRVPTALQPFMCGIKFVPFVKKLDKKGKLVAIPAAEVEKAKAAAEESAAPAVNAELAEALNKLCKVWNTQ